MSVINIYSKINIKNPYNHIYKDTEYDSKNCKKHNNNNNSNNNNNNNNINILGSILNSKEDLNLESNGNINILNVKDSEYSYYKYKESKINLGNMLLSIASGVMITTIAGQLGAIDLIANNSIGAAVGAMSNDKPIYSEDTTIRETFNQNVVNSSLNSGNNINIISRKDTNIQSSDLNSDNDVNIATIDGNVNVLTSFNETTVKNTSKHKEIGKTFIEAKGGSLSAGLKGEMSSGDVKNTTKTAVSSNINSNNNVNIISDYNINIIGSNMGSNNETNLIAENNVNILSTENLESTSGEFKEGELKVGVKVGNAYIDTYNAGDVLVKAGEDVKRAKDELHRIKQLEKEGKASKSAVKDAELNLAMATINLTNATIAFAGSAAGAATAASTSFGTGFYGSAFESFEGTKTKSSSETITNKESQIITNNGDINVIAKNNDITQKRSLVFSDNCDINYRANNDINIIASQDTFKASSKTENINESVSVGNNAMQVGFGYGKSTSNTNSVTNNGSYIGTNNGTINLNTDNNDINIKGANIEANNIDIDVANNLNIESLQDSYYNKSNSNNFGLNVGGNSSSINGGFNVGSSKGTIDNQWVNNQTSIMGNDKVDIKVGTKENSEGNTNIKGSLIASGSYDDNGNFVDNNNLTLTTNTLIYEDIKDFYNNTSKGFNFSTSIGANKTDQNNINLHPQGTTTIGLTNKGEEKEQITKTTVGNGSISVKNKINGKDILINENNKSNQNTLLSDLNRDINKSQQTTKDQITSALDGNVSIDNRLFTKGGRDDIGDEIRNMDKNLGQSLKNLTENNIIVKSIKNAYTDDTKNIIDTINDYKNDTNKLKDIQKDNNLTGKLNGLTNLDAEGVKNTMQDVVDVASRDGGFSGEVNLYDIDEQTKGYAYSNDGNDNHIGFNTNTNDLANSNDVINTLFHETTNQEQHNKNEQTALNRGDTAEAIWDMLNYGNKNTNSKENITSKGKIWNQENSDSSVIAKGNLNRVNDYSNYYQENIKNSNENVKLDELTVFVHGTFSNPDTFTPEFKESIKRLTGDKKQVDFKWSGGNTKKARAEAANELLNLIKNYEFEKDEPLNIIGHSHGGNDVKEYSHLVGDNGITGKNGTKPSIANAYLFAIPNRKDYIMKDGVFDNYYNIYNKNDKLVQDVAGGVDFIFGKIPNIFKAKNPSQTTNEAGVINIPVDQDYTDYSNTFNNFTNNLENSNGNIFYKLLIDFEIDNTKGQLKNHIEMKNPETVNEIYNQNLIRNRKNLKRYDNFINKIRR